MKIIVLSENTACLPYIGAEHGLSLYIETQNHKILFDMGQSDLFLQNAVKLGIDLSSLDFAVLSHGHYDHGGGMAALRTVNAQVPLYVSRHAFGAFYSDKYIGLAPAAARDGHLVLTDGVHCLAKGITLYANGEVPLFSAQNRGLYMKEAGILHPDDFCHEQYLLVEEAGKRVLFSGCSHKGVVNIARYFAPDVLVGGFHFKKMDVQKDGAFLEEAAKKLLEIGSTYYTCHCTGTEQYAFLKGKMGDRLHYLASGETVVL